MESVLVRDLVRYNTLSSTISAVPKEGIEPSIPKEHEFESCAYASSATSAFRMRSQVYHSQYEGQDK